MAAIIVKRIGSLTLSSKCYSCKWSNDKPIVMYTDPDETLIENFDADTGRIFLVVPVNFLEAINELCNQCCSELRDCHLRNESSYSVHRTKNCVLVNNFRNGKVLGLQDIVDQRIGVSIELEVSFYWQENEKHGMCFRANRISCKA